MANYAKTVLKNMGKMFVWMVVSLPDTDAALYRCNNCGGNCGFSSRVYTSLDEKCGYCDGPVDYKNLEDAHVQAYLKKKEENVYSL